MTLTSRNRERPKAKTSTGTMNKKPAPKRRNAPAATLADPRYRARVVKSVKAYSRKKKAKPGEADGT